MIDEESNKLVIYKEWFEKNKHELLEKGDKDWEEKGLKWDEDVYVINLDNYELQDAEFKDCQGYSDDKIYFWISEDRINNEQKIKGKYWFNIKIKLPVGIQYDIVKSIQKRINKIKAVFEGLR